jgi:probable phosphoglycerate mutase
MCDEQKGRNLKTIITIQHTESLQHINGMVGSWTDWELTDSGKKCAENIGRNLSAELDGRSCKIYSSDLTRTKQTAEPLCKRLGLSAEYRSELREQNLGEAVGKSKEWARARVNKNPGIDGRKYTGAETLRELWSRLSIVYSEMMTAPQETIVVVSHGGALELFHAMAAGLEIESVEKLTFHASPGGVSKICVDSAGKRIFRAFSDMSYSVASCERS